MSFAVPRGRRRAALSTVLAVGVALGCGSATALATPPAISIDCSSAILSPGAATNRAVIEQCESVDLLVNLAPAGRVALPDPGMAVTIHSLGIDSSHTGTAYRAEDGELVT